MDFQGRVALITGAATGIGRATALAFARDGAKVVAADVDDRHAGETVQLVRDAGGEAVFVRCDVSRSEDCRHAVEAAVRHYGKLDCAFNNAGIEGKPASTADYDEGLFRRVIDINLLGVWYGMKHQLLQMQAQGGGGAIVNCASILGQVGYATASAYAAAKHGVLGLTRTAAIEFASQGIRVNAVCPGFIVTPMLERAGMLADPAVRAQIESLHPVGRLGTPEEVAEAVLWLCSPGASFVHGHPLLVDGGFVAR